MAVPLAQTAPSRCTRYIGTERPRPSGDVPASHHRATTNLLARRGGEDCFQLPTVPCGVLMPAAVHDLSEPKRPFRAASPLPRLPTQSRSAGADHVVLLPLACLRSAR